MSYLAKYRRYLNGFIQRHKQSDPGLRMPTKWGFHAYGDVKDNEKGIRPQNGTAYFSRGIPSGGALWFSEVGSRVDTDQAGSTPAHRIPRNTAATQKSEVCFLFTLAAYYHVERLYYYHYWEPDSVKARDGFDAGLAEPTGNFDLIGPRRPAYDAVQARGC